MDVSMEQKKMLIEQLLALVESELQTLQRSMQNAAEAATHPDSKPENKYDTRGLEASYLAGAQKERLAELTGARQLLESMPLRSFTADDKIAPTALIKLEQNGQESWCFLLVWGAGYQLNLGSQTLFTVTPQSPLGKALLHKQVGDAMQIRTQSGIKSYEVLDIS